MLFRSESLDAAVYARLDALGERLESRLGGLPEGRARFQRVGAMATLFLHPGPVRTFADVEACDKDGFSRLFRSLLERGHFLPPAQFEAFFLSTAHTEADVDSLASGILEFLA